MAVNTSPVFGKTPYTGFNNAVTAANTAKDGTGTAYQIFDAGSDGAILEFVRNIGNATNVQTVMRIWGNNGSAQSSAANNYPLWELTIPAKTTSETTAQVPEQWDANYKMPASHRVYVTYGTAVANGNLPMANGSRLS